MKRIDAHIYCLPPSLRDLRASLPESEIMISKAIYQHPESAKALSLVSPESILSSMDEAKIDTGVLVAFPWVSSELCEKTNTYLLELAQKEKRFSVITSLNPKIWGWEKQTQAYLEAGAVGFKINGEWQGFELHSECVVKLGEWIVAHNSFLMTHIDQPTEFSKTSPAHLLSLARQLPQLKILAAHLGGLLGISALHPPIAQNLQNVWFDTAISSTLQMVDFMVRAGFEDKIIFGSDFPFNHSHSQKQVCEGVEELGLPDLVLEKIFSKNWEALIR